jgi:NAD(P)-dependent dehydrogenase (short-subunit alcohol dehydrogenase family)
VSKRADQDIDNPLALVGDLPSTPGISSHAPPTRSQTEKTPLGPARPAPDRFRLDGKVAFVTEASRPVGLSVVLALARAGVDIAASGSSPAALKQVSELVEEQSVRVHTIASNMSSDDEIISALTGAHRALGQIDIVVHCVKSCSFTAGYLDQRRADPAQRAEASLIDIARICDHVGQLAVALGTSSLVIIASPSNLRPWPDITGGVVRRASLELIKTGARNLAPKGVRVNAVTPGPVSADPHAPSDAGQRAVCGFHVPPSQWDTAGDVADAALWLASDAAAHISGAHVAFEGAQSVEVVADRYDETLRSGIDSGDFGAIVELLRPHNVAG